MTTQMSPFAQFTDQQTVLLTTYKRNGDPVETPVNVAVEGDHAYFRTWDTAWKIKRIRRNPEVAVAPSTNTGKATGPAIRAHAQILSGQEYEHAGELIAKKHPFLQGLFVPLVHRLRRQQTMHLKLTQTNP